MQEKRRKAKRGKAKSRPPERIERKEKVLHTRVPESLETELKGKAGRLGLSVSNLVRNILQNTFDMVDDIVHDSQTIARTARGEPVPTRRGAAAILGWQDLVLNVNGVCERCNAILPKGTAAHVSVLDGPGPRTFRCPRCMGKPGR